jgi:hypothetical protein
MGNPAASFLLVSLHFRQLAQLQSSRKVAFSAH